MSQLVMRLDVLQQVEAEESVWDYNGSYALELL